MIQRHIVFSVLNPILVQAATRYGYNPTRRNHASLQLVIEAIECARELPLAELTKLLKDVPPSEYVKVMCDQ